jgi:signal transduction histidine kinase
MQRRVEILLDVARSQARQRSPERSRFGLWDCLEGCYEPFREEADSRHLRLNPQIPPALEVVTDRPLLERLLGNLAQNAVRYAREGSVIKVTAVEGDSRVELTISNEVAPGPRKDHHSGLGLSLAQRILDELGGSMTVSPGDSHFRVTIRLPALARPGG